MPGEGGEPMSADTMTPDTIDPDGRWLYRVGGISALLLGIGYVVTIPLYASVGAPPSGGEAWLAYAAGRTGTWWAILGLSVLTDILFVPVVLALYHALHEAGRGAMQLAAAFVLLFVVLDLAVTWTNYAALITLTDAYATAVTGAQRAAYVAAATYPAAVLASSLEGVYSIGVLSVGILVAGLVMLRTGFGRAAAWLGVATGVLGIVSVAGPFIVPGLGAAVIVASVLTTAWALVTGWQLRAPARR